jgi:CheY-like chemotaxis protein
MLSPAASKPLRVLIVEDEILISMFLSDVLGDLGHTVVGTASSAHEALNIAAEQPSDLAFIDVGLSEDGGGGDGLDAALALRERHGVPTVLMTGDARHTDSSRSQRAKLLGVLLKPYTEADVERALGVALERLNAKAG